LEGQFHKKMTLIRNNDAAAIRAVVSGPIENWKDDETSADFTVEIKAQNGATLSATSSDDVPNGAREWVLMAIVDDGAFQEGDKVTGTLTARISKKDGNVDWWHCTTPLDPNDPPELTVV
jgi:hypothetical protein